MSPCIKNNQLNALKVLYKTNTNNKKRINTINIGLKYLYT